MYFRIGKKNKHKLDDRIITLIMKHNIEVEEIMKHLSRKYQSREKKYFLEKFCEKH